MEKRSLPNNRQSGRVWDHSRAIPVSAASFLQGCHMVWALCWARGGREHGVVEEYRLVWCSPSQNPFAPGSRRRFLPCRSGPCMEVIRAQHWSDASRKSICYQFYRPHSTQCHKHQVPYTARRPTLSNATSAYCHTHHSHDGASMTSPPSLCRGPPWLRPWPAAAPSARS